MDEQPPGSDDNLPDPAPDDHSTADYDQYVKAETGRNWPRIFSILILIIVLAGAAYGAYHYLKTHKSAKPRVTQTTQAAAPAKVAVATKRYDSTNFYLGFDYPSNWAIIDNGGGVMTVTSPATQLKSASGETVSGKIVLTIRNKAQKLPEFTAGNATAVLPSVKITYTKPTQTQRAATYESFLQYASSTSGLDGVYITGDNGYTKDQAIPAADFVPVDPVINITFLNAAGKPMTIAASSWADSTFSGPLDAMLESLSIT